MIQRPAKLLLAVLLALSSCRSSGQPVAAGHAGDDQPSAAETDQPGSVTGVVLRRDYGERGRLVVKMRQAVTLPGSSGRMITYFFNLFTRGDATPRELAEFGFADEHSLGSGEPDLSLRDAVLTTDPALVHVYSKKLDESRYAYSGTVGTLEESGLELPVAGAYEDLFYSPGEAEPRRRVSISGSLKENNLTVSLAGPRDTLRFRFLLFFHHQIGWYLAPGDKPKTPPAFIAPTLQGE